MQHNPKGSAIDFAVKPLIASWSNLREWLLDHRQGFKLSLVKVYLLQNDRMFVLSLNSLWVCWRCQNYGKQRNYSKAHASGWAKVQFSTSSVKFWIIIIYGSQLPCHSQIFYECEHMLHHNLTAAALQMCLLRLSTEDLWCRAKKCIQTQLQVKLLFFVMRKKPSRHWRKTTRESMNDLKIWNSISIFILQNMPM